MRIGEVSKKYDISIEALRYYDKIGLLTAERKNGNRYYDEKDINKIQSIKALKEMMFSLEDIKRVLEIDEKIDEGLEDRVLDNDEIKLLLREIEVKYTEVLEREKQLRKVKERLGEIIEKIDDLKRRNGVD